MILATIVFWLGAAADVYTTKRALLDGIVGFKERNPIARFFLKWGLIGLVAMKVAVFVPFLWLSLRLGFESAGVVAFWLMGVVQLAAAWSNRRLILRKRGN